MTPRLIDLLRATDDAVDGDDHRRALQLILNNWFHLPDPSPLRERTALGLASRRREAVEIYRLVARHYANSGFPSRSLASIKQMLALNPSSTELLDHFTTLYSVRSPFLDRNLTPPTLPEPASEITLEGSDSTELDTLLEWAVERATDPDTIADRPGSLPPLPLLSLLPPKPLRRLLDHLEYEIFAQAQPLFSSATKELFWTVSADFTVSDDDDSFSIPSSSLLGIDLFLDRPSSMEATIQSARGSECLKLGPQAFQALTDEFADFPNRVATLHRHALTSRLIASHPLFEGLSDEGRTRLPEVLTGLRIQPGTPLIRKGKISPGLYILLDGTVTLTTDDDGEGLQSLRPGDSLGEIGLHEPRPALFDATATDDVHLLFMNREAFASFVDDHPSLGDAANEIATQRLHLLDSGS